MRGQGEGGAKSAREALVWSRGWRKEGEESGQEPHCEITSQSVETERQCTEHSDSLFGLLPQWPSPRGQVKPHALTGSSLPALMDAEIHSGRTTGTGFLHAPRPQHRMARHPMAQWGSVTGQYGTQ